MSISRKLMTVGGGGGSYVDDVFSTYLYEGDQTTSSRQIVNGIDLDDKGGLVWIKERSQDRFHFLFDTERGEGYRLSTNSTEAESSFSNESLQSFNSDGFTIGDFYGVSETGEDFASWSFAKQEGFFDVVTYTGNGVAGREIPHNLGSEPGMVIIKCTSKTTDWYVQHRSVAGGLVLNTVAAATVNYGTALDLNADTLTLRFNGNYALDRTNGPSETYVAYLFAHDAQEFGPAGDESIIKCGSYVGNGVPSDGPVIDLGWEPQWVMIKAANPSSTVSCDWVIFDSMRGLTSSYPDVKDPPLAANVTSNESNLISTGTDIAPLANGFQITNNGGRVLNESGTTYIYMAIRRPMKPAEEFEPDELFALDTATTADPYQLYSGFPVDMAWRKYVGGADNNYLSARLIQAQQLVTNDNVVAAADSASTFDFMEGWYSGGQGTGTHSWMFRRAPGFFDVVTYEGDGVDDKVIPHNLQAVPEMFWMKSLSTTGDWFAYNKDLPLGFGDNYSGYLSLNSAAQASVSSAIRMSGLTDESLMCSPQTGMNQLGVDYITYLFASVPGICDIGTYTGNGQGPWSSGTSLQIDCGFTNGARFVLVKRTDAGGNWMYFDTLRGSQSTLALNLTDAQVVAQYGTDAPWPQYAPGFAVVGYNFDSAAYDPNIDGAEYIYMAIA